jgi:membrane-bound metal-dependent hydrolase YbcI (DUF457 family)
VTVWPLFVWKQKKFNFFGLSLGSIIADLEIPFLLSMTSETLKARSIMHSIIGAFTIDFIIVIGITLYLVPFLLKYLEKIFKNKNIFMFSKTDLRNHKTSYNILIYSTLIGTVSHVFIDLFNHYYNPLTFPFEEYYFFNLVLFNNLRYANIVLHGLVIILFILMIYFWYLKNLIKK